MKGKIFLIGGNEDKEGKQLISNADSILKRFIEESRKKQKSRIEIITSASSVPKESGKDYLDAFRALGADNTAIMLIEDRSEADDHEILKRLHAADAVFVTGGDQLRLTAILGGTEFYNILVQKLEEPDFMYAGSSAGTAAASKSMLLNGRSEDAAYKGTVHTATGLGFVDNIIFDTHFITRGRIGRLFEIVVSNPTILGVGLEENTALLIHRNRMEAVGPGSAIVLDGRGITGSNLNEVIEGAPLSIENMTLHLMSETDQFDLKERKLKIINPPEVQINQ